MTRTLKTFLSAALIGAALATALTLPASAELRTVTVRMADGSLQSVVLDVPPETTLEGMAGLVEGEPISYSVIDEPPAPPPEPAPAPEPAPEPPPAPPVPPAAPPAPPAAPAPSPPAPTVLPEEQDARGEVSPPADTTLTEPTHKPARKPKRLTLEQPRSEVQHEGETEGKAKVEPRAPAMRRPDGSPSPSNPGFVDALPGPSFATGVPNFVIRKFRVPIFLLPIYQAAGIEYGVRWEILAAINEIETDYGRNLNVSSAGALGWMQFIPSSWEAYGVDANKDGKKDPYNPVDAIFAAARYLKAADYESDVRGAIFAYNHADWYVDSVLLRARLIAGIPADLVGSLTGLTEGRFPIAARARYADDLAEKEQLKRVAQGENAANLIESDDERASIEIYAQQGAPVVATNDGQIKKIGRNRRLGRYVVLQDVYGNRYTYTGLGQTATYYPVPKADATDPDNTAQALKANGAGDAAPASPASKGAQPERETARTAPDKRAGTHGEAQRAAASTPIKERLFAHPDMPQSRSAGGLEQLLDMKALREGGYTTYGNHFARAIKLDSDRFRLRRMRAGSHVIGGTVLGAVGRPDPAKAAHLEFAIRPAGKGAPQIDPKPILDGWKLLEATAIYRATGRNALHGDGDAFSIGQILLMPKPMLERRVLSDSRIEVYGCGADDIRAGQIDRRVLATMAFLAEAGMRPTVTSLKCGHGFFTSSGNVSHHSSGNALDIAQINGIPILGHQESGGITEQAVRRLMTLQGSMEPSQIISLLDLGANTVAMGDHADHIHVGFQPHFGANSKLGAQAEAVLKPGQWPELLKRLEEIENPVVPTKPSPYALPVRKPLRGLSTLP